LPSGATLGGVVFATVISGSINVIPFNITVGSAGVSFNLYNLGSAAATVTPAISVRYIG
jgi:hypothetical protein